MAGRPSRLRFAVGGFQGPSWRVELIADLLVHIEAGWGYEPRVMAPFVVSERAWRDLSDALDALDVWSWTEAPDDTVLEQAEWSVGLTWGGRDVNASGGPLPDGWEDFCQAVQAWAGGRPFG